jgi:hypothetical protein
VQTERSRETERGFLLALDQIRARLRVLSMPESVANRPDAPAHTVTRFDDRHIGVPVFERLRRGETRKSGAGNENLHVLEAGHAPIVDLVRVATVNWSWN